MVPHSVVRIQTNPQRGRGIRGSADGMGMLCLFGASGPPHSHSLLLISPARQALLQDHSTACTAAGARPKQSHNFRTFSSPFPGGGTPVKICFSRFRSILKNLKEPAVRVTYYSGLLLISLSAALICFHWQVDPGRMTRAILVRDFRYALVGAPILVIVKHFTGTNN